ncbi:formylmethanofuran dehydrogenase subunit B [Burkholderiales bacterium JOSHI_001]|nr:formylmethanofuran dehydrogenase subunit B [Burkholderiales bacterium JOSHI_001]
MSATLESPTQAPTWTCPFCALLCDGFDLAANAAGSAPSLNGSTCPRARQALAGLHAAGSGPWVDGQAATHDAAITAAVQRLGAWRAPLFGGGGTDIAGARALYRLAARCEAITDHADGDGLFRALRALQDRGQYTVTLGDARAQAELVVCVGTPASAYPELFRRLGLAQAGSPCRELVFLGVPPPAHAPHAMPVTAVAGCGDIATDLQALAAAVDGRSFHDLLHTDVAGLAARLKASPYSVLVIEPGTLGPQGALLMEMANRIVGQLNRKTRSALLPLGGNDGAAALNQTLTWLSGLPLRTRVGAQGLRHEPLLYGSSKLLADGAVDGLLWVMSFNAERLPPANKLPCIVLGPPAMGPRLQAASAANTVFIPVATPGLNAAGHLFRTDGPVVLPLQAHRDDGLPGVAAVAEAMLKALGAAA